MNNKEGSRGVSHGECWAFWAAEIVPAKARAGGSMPACSEADMARGVEWDMVIQGWQRQVIYVKLCI